MTDPDSTQARREAALLEAARAGDPDAYGALIGPCQRPLYAYALRLTGDPHLAEDLCQDALLKGFRAIGGFGGQSALATWLYRILHNTWLDHLKRARRETPYETGSDDEAGEPPVLAREAVARFHDRARRTDARERLAAALDALPPAMREVVVLRDVQGHTYEEIAEITGSPVGTIKSRLARAREQLRGLLTDAGAPEAGGTAVQKG